MHVRLLGTAAGGGYPQWNCHCANCQAARAGDGATEARSQTCVAFSADAARWYLIGASPDMRFHLESFAPLRASDAVRGSAIEAVLLASADLDHVLGLFLLREGGRMHVHATAEVRRSLCDGLRLEAVLGRYCGLKWHEPPARPGRLKLRDGQPSGLLYEAFPAPGKPPRYRDSVAEPGPGDCVGYRIEDTRTGGRLAVLPAAAALPPSVLCRLQDCDAVLLDGTFWSENELVAAGAGETPARLMGHLPIGGRGGSLEQIAGLRVSRRILIHINNTNPVLISGSPERREVEHRGVEIGHDGLELDL
jgi:pyrroloquinoline quinone biosynthesis protein B